MNRVNRILIGALAVQVVLVAIVFLPRVFPTSVESAPLFGTVNAEDVTALTIQDKDGNTVHLARQGDAWVVPSSDDYPADKTKIDAFLNKIIALKTNPLVTRTSASHKRLKVADDDFERKVDVTLADGASRTVYVGTSSGGGAHVRVGGQDEVYLASDLTSFDANTQITNWIDSTYFSATQESIYGVAIQNANGAVEFEKDAAGAWTMKGLAAGEAFNESNFTPMLSRLSSVSLNRPLGKQLKPEYGLDKPAAVVTLKAKDDSGSDKTYTLTVGAKDETDNTYVLKSSESAYYVRVAFFAVEDFVDRSRDVYLQPPPTPTATPDVTATPEITATLELTPTLQVTPTP